MDITLPFIELISSLTMPMCACVQSKAKDLEKHQKETRDLLLQANPPLAPFGWAHMPLFDDLAQLRYNGSVAMRELFPLKTVLTDEQLCVFFPPLSLYISFHALYLTSATIRYDEINLVDKKQKIMTGHLSLEIRKLAEKEELHNRLDTALLPVKPFTQTERDPAAVRHRNVN